MYKCAISLAVLVLGVDGHGYVKTPPSRGYLCSQKVNSGCGQVQYEPQSVEGDDRYPASGPADGHIASAGKAVWGPLDAQSRTRWAKTAASGGATDFVWQFTANHITLDWRYYITKDGWNPDTPLTRDSFEASPFCAFSGGMTQPPMVTTHTCVLPSKSGYHVVMAIWDVGDTAASFYNAIDLDFGGAGTPPVTPPTPATPPPSTAPPATTPPATPATPRPTTVPAPPSGGCAARIPMWGPCINNKGCCVSGAVCDQQSQWYAQCIPASVPSTPPTPPSNPPPAPPQTNQCRSIIPEWGSCLHAPTCCTAGASCYKQSRWYAQCSKTAHFGYKIG